ncbi:MAG: hypothetical protein AAB449_01250 [Patescibacteria group bacterium]
MDTSAPTPNTPGPNPNPAPTPLPTVSKAASKKSLLFVSLALLVLGASATGAYWYYTPQKSANITPPMSEDEWVLYSDSNFGISFSHPPTWQCKTAKTILGQENYQATCDDDGVWQGDSLIAISVPADTEESELFTKSQESKIITNTGLEINKTVLRSYYSDEAGVVKYIAVDRSFDTFAWFGPDKPYRNVAQAELILDRIVKSINTFGVDKNFIIGVWQDKDSDTENVYTSEYRNNGVLIAKHNGVVQVYDSLKKEFVTSSSAQSTGKWFIVTDANKENREMHERFPGSSQYYLPSDAVLLKEDYGSLVLYSIISFSEDGNTLTTIDALFEAYTSENIYTRIK